MSLKAVASSILPNKPAAPSKDAEEAAVEKVREKHAEPHARKLYAADRVAFWAYNLLSVSLARLIVGENLTWVQYHEQKAKAHLEMAKRPEPTRGKRIDLSTPEAIAKADSLLKKQQAGVARRLAAIAEARKRLTK